MVKVISLSERAYEELSKRKNGKSFSELVLELVESKPKDISQFFGAWKNKPELVEVFRDVNRGWKKLKLKEVRL